MASNESQFPQNSNNPAESNPPQNHSQDYQEDHSQHFYDESEVDAPQHVFTPNKPLSEEPSKMFSTKDLEESSASIEGGKKLTEQQAIQKDKKASIAEKWQTINLSKLNGDVLNHMKTNKEQTIIYILLALGLILMLFANSLLGALIIGMVAGYYFASEIIYFVRNLGQLVSGQDQLHYVVLATIALGLFIEAPGIFIGAIVVATFKQVLTAPQG